MRLLPDQLDSAVGAALAAALNAKIRVRYAEDDEPDGLSPDQLDDKVAEIKRTRPTATNRSSRTVCIANLR